VLDYCTAYFQPYFAHHAQDISFGRVGVGSHHKIRGRQGVKVGYMTMHKMGAVKQFP